jgi:hypothetical protein
MTPRLQMEKQISAGGVIVMLFVLCRPAVGFERSTVF